MQTGWQKVVAVFLFVGMVAFAGSTVSNLLESNIGSISDIR